jgi:ornithine--oxo-acid transaminase
MHPDFKDLLAKLQGSNFELHEQHINPQFSRVLRTIGFDHCYTRGVGPYLWDDKGNQYLDMMSGYGVFNLGRNHPLVKQALKDYLDLDYPSLVQMEAPLLSGLLAAELKKRMPNQLDIVYFTNSGTEGVETAIKFARCSTGRPVVLHCKKAFHGLSTGSLALNGDESFRKGFEPFLPGCRMIPFNDLNALERELMKGDVAGFIVEPVQGKGVNLPSAGYLRDAAALCRRHGALFIADEVQSGMGRTGRFLALEHDGDVDPDIVILSKALSGGYVPVGAVLTRRRIYDRVFSSMDRAVVHSSTFGQGGMAMAAGLATLAVMDEFNLMAQAEHIGRKLGEGLQAMQTRYELIKDIRWRGCMVGIEFGPPRSLGLRTGWEMVHAMDGNLFPQAVTMPLMQDHRVLTQVAGHHIDVIKLLPALVMNDEDIRWFLKAFEDVMQKMDKFPGPAWDVLSRLGKIAISGRGNKNIPQPETPAATQTPADVERAASMPVIGKSSGSTWVHRIARRAVRPLVNTSITPNHLTTLRLVTGVAAAAAFAVGDYFWTAWGGLLFVISAFLDRADGELARMKEQTSSQGHRYDLISDAAVTVLLFIGIGIGLSNSTLGWWAPLLGIVSGASVAAIFWVVTRMEQKSRESRPAFGSVKGFDPDDVLFIVGPFAWLDDLITLLLASSLGAPLFLMFALYQARHRKFV